MVSKTSRQELAIQRAKKYLRSKGIMNKRDEDKIKFCNINDIVLLEYFDGDNSLSDLDEMLDF